MASPEYSTTWPVPPAIPIFADDGEDDVFGGDAFGALPVDDDVHRLRFVLGKALRREHMLDFAGANPKRQGSERAVRRGVAVAADNGLTGLRNAEFRPDDMHDALILAEHD